MAYSGPSVKVRFELLNRETVNVKSYRINSAYMTSTDSFEITLYEPKKENRKDLELQPVSIYINDNLHLIGRVEQTTYSGNGYEVTIAGRDYISDMVECHVDPALKIKENTTLGATIVDAAKPVGITKVVGEGGKQMRNLRTGASIGGSIPKDISTLKEEEYKPKPGEGVYQFCDRLCARHGVTIQPTAKRSTLELAEPSYTQDVAYQLVRSGDQTRSARNNILNATVRKDYSKFPTYTFGSGKVGKGGASKSSVQFEIETKESDFPTFGFAHKGRIHPVKGGEPKAKNGLYRLFYLRDELAKNKEQLARSVKRAWSERCKDVLQYQATMLGHNDISTGKTYAIDTIATVADEIANIDEKMWIEAVTYQYDASSGATSTLTLWLPGSFVI